MDDNTGRVWEHSATATPDVPYLWPDPIASGVDIIGTTSINRPKPAVRRARDEADPRFMTLIDPAR